MAVLTSVGRGLAVALTIVLFATPALAQTATVTNGVAEVRLWYNAKEIGHTVPPGTIVQIMEKAGGWCWVVLPPDANGTRRVGWIRTDQLRMNSTPPPEVVPGESVMAAAAAAARIPPPPPPPPDRQRFHGFVQGVGGLTFGSGGAPLLGGAVGLNVTPSVQVTFEVGRMWNIVPESLEIAAARAARSTEQLILIITGRSAAIAFDAELPSEYGMGGVRYRAPMRGRIGPYLSGHAGLARVQSDVRFTLDGTDITQSIVGVREVDVAERALIWGGGVGVTSILSKRLVLDVGYRFLRIETTAPLNVNRAYAGLGVTF